MKKIIVLLASIFISYSAFTQVITFKKYYLKSEFGGQPELIDNITRTIEFKDHSIEVTNLFGCEYTSEYRILEKLAENKYVIAYEGREVVLVYSPKDQILVVTTGEGVKGERTLHLYAEY